jgi:succinyl-CoA synthetase beta subunit
MRLHEFQAKEMFAEYGITTPRGKVAHSPEEAGKIAAEIGAPVALKAQVLVGGRGLAGGIKFADDSDEAEEVASLILGESLRNKDVNFLLVEEKLDIETEYYLGVTIDYRRKCPVVIASSRGGMDIERIASEFPDQIIKEEIRPPLGLTDFQTRRIAKKAGVVGRNQRHFAATVKKLYSILRSVDATLVEINPLALTTDNQFIAADAKITLDDNASFRHRELYSRLKSVKKRPSEGKKLRKALAEEAEIPTYLELSGNLGIISDGAGTGMSTFDLTKDFGGKVEAYCELGGKATPDLIEKALEIIASNSEVTVILINLIGGLNRMDEMAQGIATFVAKRRERLEGEMKPAIVVRMSGTLEDEGREILGNSGVTAFDNIYDAIERAVELAGGS